MFRASVRAAHAAARSYTKGATLPGAPALSALRTTGLAGRPAHHQHPLSAARFSSLSPLIPRDWRSQAWPPSDLFQHRGIVTSGGAGDDGDGKDGGDAKDKDKDKGDSGTGDAVDDKRSGNGSHGRRRRRTYDRRDAEDRVNDTSAPASAAGGGTGVPPSGDEPPEVPVDVEPPEEKEVMMDTAGAGSEGLLAPPVVPEFVPEVIVIPVTRNPIFPKFIKVLEISDPRLISKIKHRVKTGHPYAGAFLRKDETADDSKHINGLDEVEPIGTFVQIQEIAEHMEEGKLRVLIQGHRRIHVTGQALDGEPGDVPSAKVDNIKDKEYDRHSQEIRAMCNEIIKTIRDIVKLNPLFREWVNQILEMGQRVLDNPSHLSDFGAALTSARSDELQAILTETDVEVRLAKTLDLLKREYLQCKLQNKISQEVEDKITKSRREHMLQEQLKIIKRELGLTKDDKETVVTKFRERIKGVAIPQEASQVIEDELNKLAFLEPQSSEFNVTRNYLDWLTQIPWGKTTEDNFDIPHAQSILDEDHYGMTDVKDRVLEFIAVGSLLKSVQGKILCFVGPPGVGKTSIAKSIARALNRKYYRFSVGGLHDVAEIKGHRRTYIGAMPGKPIQSLKITQTSNALVLIDEIDKIGKGHNGDPTSALLELLDPEQNVSFLDHYLDVPVDMSKILYVCTANVLETIPGPLLDRMEVIQLSGYMADEKIEIAKRYLIPQCLKHSGLTADQVIMSDETIGKLIRAYCRESGVRNLQKQLEKIYRKAAFKTVKEGLPAIEITPENLQQFVGNEVFTRDRMYETTPPGVVMGLAWTSMGGAHLYIETVSIRVPTKDDKDPSPGFRVTGQLGDVMKESSAIAYTYAKHFLSQAQTDNMFFSRADISMHIPEGATPKDGPSAGITMVTALLSLALDKPVKQDIAMTGEISLTGKVLRVGGIKEKILAAKRANIKEIIMPDSCRPDFLELPESVRSDIAVHFVKHYDEVYKIALGYDQ